MQKACTDRNNNQNVYKYIFLVGQDCYNATGKHYSTQQPDPIILHPDSTLKLRWEKICESETGRKTFAEFLSLVCSTFIVMSVFI
jgi:hypothetical protein